MVAAGNGPSGPCTGGRALPASATAGSLRRPVYYLERRIPEWLCALS